MAVESREESGLVRMMFIPENVYSGGALSDTTRVVDLDAFKGACRKIRENGAGSEVPLNLSPHEVDSIYLLDGFLVGVKEEGVFPRIVVYSPRHHSFGVEDYSFWRGQFAKEFGLPL